MEKKHKPTVKDVALRAGVSPSTVSRVLSNHPKISQATKDRVWREMEAIGYQPNAIARSLARSQTNIIGVIIPSRGSDALLNPFFPEALRGIVKGASEHGYDVLLSTGRKGSDEMAIVKNFIGSGKVDGLILMTSRDKDPVLQYLTKTSFPFVVIGSANDLKVNHVDNDNVGAAYQLTKHLIDGGKRNIFFASGPMGFAVSRDRLKGYRKALEEAGLPYKEDHILTGNFDEESGMRIADLIFTNNDQPDGVITTDDVIAFGLSRALTSYGYKVPEDIALASFNNSVLSRYSDCQLTTVDINAYKLGKGSAELAVKAIEEDLRDGNVTVDHELILRKSTLG